MRFDFRYILAALLGIIPGTVLAMYGHLDLEHFRLMFALSSLLLTHLSLDFLRDTGKRKNSLRITLIASFFTTHVWLAHLYYIGRAAADCDALGIALGSSLYALSILKEIRDAKAPQ